MIERILIALITRLGAFLYARALKKIDDHAKEKAESDQATKAMSEKLERIKTAYAEAFNGNPISKDQRQELNRSIRDFLRAPSSGL